MADPTWEESAPVEAGTPNWEDTTAIEVEPPPVQGVTAEQIQARRLSPQQETLRRAALGELDLGPYTGMLGPHREEKAAEAIQFLSSLQEPPISIPRPTGRTTLGKIGAGVVRGAAPLIESVVSPAGLILAGAGGPGAGKVAQYGMRGAFAGIAAKAAKEAWDRARRTKDPQDYTEAIVASAGVPLVLGTPEVAPRQVRPVVPPDVLGRFLPTPPGAPAPRIEPPVIEMASPEAAAASARAMQRRATAAYEPPRLAPPQVPEGPLEPPTVTPEPPPAPPELATWDDFVAHLSRNGTGLETRNQIRAMFADVVPGMSSEAAAKLARDAFGAEWTPGGRLPQAPARAEPPTAPVAPPAPPAPTPPTPGRLEWMGKPLEEWEKMTSSADLPKGGARVRLARSLGLAQDTPARILAAIKKRTGEIRAAAATKPPPPPPEAPGAAPVPVPTPPKPPAAPAAAAEKVTLYTGKGGVGGAGEGGSWFTGNLEKARSYGPDVRAVEVPREVADQAKKAAQQQGQGGDTYFLTREHADKAQPIAAPPAKVTEIPTEETTAAESFAKETGWTFSPSAAVMPTPEELAALSPEKRAQFQAIHQANGWEFTDRRPDSPTKGMTFYTKIGATPEEIRAAYAAHLAKNAPKAAAPPAVRPPAGELFAVPEGPRTGAAARSYIVRRLEELEDVDPITGEAFPKEDLTEAQEKARRRFREMLADIEAKAKPAAKPLATPEEQAAEQARLAAETGEEPPTPPPAAPAPAPAPAAAAPSIAELQAQINKQRGIVKRSNPYKKTGRQDAIAKAAGATETERVSSEVVSKLNAEMNKLAKEREGIIAEGQKRQKTSVHVTAPPTTPPPGASFFASPANPLGAPVSPQAVTFHSVFLAPLERLPERTRILWRRFAMQSAPRITAMLRAAGEAGVRLAAAPFVSRTKGEQFAAQVLEGIKEPLFDRKLGEALTEDNLRDLKRSFQDRADEAADPDTFIDDLKQQISELQEIADDGDVDARKAIAGMKRDIERISGYTSEDAQAFQDSADAVTSVIGVQNAWFRTEDEYQAFLRSPAAREAIARHIQLWKEEKDPLYRQANDLDPDLPVQTRGLQTGARVNLKAVMPGEGTATTVGPAARTPLVRQAATLIRKDPFGRPATGAAKSYEVSYRELMANGFGREYPVAKQHEFIRILLDSGKGVLRDRGFESDLMIGGERAQKAGYLMTLRPWAKKWLYAPESIAPEVQSILGLEPSTRLGFASDIGDVLTKLSITGFAEGTTHISNLSIEMLTGLGPTANPMLNALIKSMGRPDILWRLPKTLIEGFSNRKAEMLALAEIGAAKRPYGGMIGWFINKIDQGGRLVSADIYKRMAAHGWVPDTETGLREFVNAGAGQYIKALQPGVIRKLRETTIQPFATALHTFNVRGLREMGLGPGAKGTSKFASLALRMDKAGGFIGFVVLLAAINRLVSGSSTGPKGTQLGNVGWIGDDGKIHQFPLARLFGYERGPRAVGALAAIEARRAGLSPGTTALKTVGAVGNTAVSYVAGPLVRFGTVAISGKRPGVPMVQEAPVMPPQDELRPLKMQAAQNILTAAQTASPAVDAVMSWKQGKPAAEIMQRQFGRYTPRTGMAPETYEALPKIIESSEMYKYADYVASRARRLPIDQRADFIVKQFEKDGVQDENWRQAWQIIRRKGVLRYE